MNHDGFAVREKNISRKETGKRYMGIKSPTLRFPGPRSGIAGRGPFRIRSGSSAVYMLSMHISMRKVPGAAKQKLVNIARKKVQTGEH